MPGCSAINCSNNARNGIRLFKVPQGPKQEDKRRIWIKNINRKNWSPICAYICEQHFTSDQFENKRTDGRRLLKWNAIPTIFDYTDSSCSKRSRQIIEHVDMKVDVDPMTPEIITIINEELPRSLLYKKGPNMCNSMQYSAENKVAILELESQIMKANDEIDSLQGAIKRTREIVLNLFQEDQISFLKGKSNDDHQWSMSSVHKALNLYITCGKIGYEESRRQGYPFPEIIEKNGKYYVNSKELNVDA